MPVRSLVYVCAKCGEDIDTEAPRKQLPAPEAWLLLDLHPACLKEAMASVGAGEPIKRSVRAKTPQRLRTTPRDQRKVIALPLESLDSAAAD